jgi:hypothetical protein
MKVRAKGRIYEGGAIYNPGDEFTIPDERAEALGDSVESMEPMHPPQSPRGQGEDEKEKQQKTVRDKQIRGSKDK